MTEKEYYLNFFKHMEEEDKKVPLGGMAWDEVSYQLYCAINKDCLFTLEELKEKFPYLLK